MVRLTRKDSYTPDPELEHEVQEILSLKEHEEENRLEKIDEEVNGRLGSDLAKSPKDYHLTDLKPKRSRAFRSSVYIKVKTGEGRARDRVGKKMPNDDS